MYSIVGFFSTGGLFMYPILVVFAIGVAIAVERYITLTRIRNDNSSVWALIQPLLKAGEFDKAREITNSGLFDDCAGAQHGAGTSGRGSAA